MGGTRMTGHSYATLLDVPAVFSAVPIDPRAVPSRTLITSPFASPTATLNRVKRVKGDDDYIIQAAAMRELIEQWALDENPAVADITKERDEEGHGWVRPKWS